MKINDSVMAAIAVSPLAIYLSEYMHPGILLGIWEKLSRNPTETVFAFSVVGAICFVGFVFGSVWADSCSEKKEVIE